MSRRTVHHLHDLRVLEGPPGNLKGSVMVCCETHRDLQMWQRVDLVIDCKSLGRGLFYSLACPIPTCGQTIVLGGNEIRWQMVVFASYVPEGN